MSERNLRPNSTVVLTSHALNNQSSNGNRATSNSVNVVKPQRPRKDTKDWRTIRTFEDSQTGLVVCVNTRHVNFTQYALTIGSRRADSSLAAHIPALRSSDKELPAYPLMHDYATVLNDLILQAQEFIQESINKGREYAQAQKDSTN